MRTTKEDVEIIKQQIIDSALKVFSSKGYSAATIQDIADELNISRGPIYYHFVNKQTLYKNAMEFSFDTFINEFNDIFNSDLSFQNKINSAVRLGYKKEIYFKFLSAHEATDIFGDINSLHEILKNRIYDVMLNEINDLFKRNEINKVNSPETIVDYIFGVFYAVSGISYNLKRTEEQIDYITKLFIDDFSQRFL